MSPADADGSRTYTTEGDIEYRPHSMVHKAIVRMDPLKLEMLDGFEETDAGHMLVPGDSNVRIIITGRNWSEKRLLIYGSKSTDEARTHVEEIISRVREIDHSANLISEPTIVNIAVNGDLKTTLQLESIVDTLKDGPMTVEYEPEQFPAAVVKIEEPESTFMLFSSGKFIIQGLKNLEDVEPAIDHLHETLESYA